MLNGNGLSLGVILALVVQSGTVVWWGSGIDEKVERLDAEKIPHRLTVVETRAEVVDEKLDRIENKIDRLTPAPPSGAGR